MIFIEDIPNVEQELDNVISELRNKNLSKPTSITGNPTSTAVVKMTNYQTIKITTQGGLTVELRKHDGNPYEIEVIYKGNTIHRDTGNKKILQQLEDIKKIFLNK